jgi:hypothetical protein
MHINPIRTAGNPGTDRIGDTTTPGEVLVTVNTHHS